MKFLNKNRILFVLYCFLSVTILINYKYENPLFNSMRTEALEILNPILSEASKALYFVSDSMDNATGLFAAFKENKKLKERNDFLEYYFYRYKQIAEENTELRKELNLSKEIIYPYISAQVIARSNNHLHQEIIINAGSNNGIKKWQMVLYHNQLVGRIIAVGLSTASVLLINDHDSKIPVMGLNSKIKCIGTGQVTSDLSCNFLGDDKPEENELVVTSYENPLILPNIVVGSILKKNGNFYIKPNLDLTKIEFVQILQPSNE